MNQVYKKITCGRFSLVLIRLPHLRFRGPWLATWLPLNTFLSGAVDSSSGSEVGFSLLLAAPLAWQHINYT